MYNCTYLIFRALDLRANVTEIVWYSNKVQSFIQLIHGIVLLDRQSPTTHVFKRYKEFHMFFVLAITKEQRQKEATRNYLSK